MRRRAQTLTVTKRVTTCSLATVVMVTVTMATTRCSDQTQKVKVLRWRITTAVVSITVPLLWQEIRRCGSCQLPCGYLEFY